MVMFRTSRRGSAVLLILIGLGGLIYLVAKVRMPDEDGPLKSIKGVVTQDHTLCVAPVLTETVGGGECLPGKYGELESFMYSLTRGTRVEVTYEVVSDRNEVRTVDVEGKPRFSDAGEKRGWKRYILHIGAGVVALIGFLMLYAYRKDP